EASVQARIARPRDRAPASTLTVDVDDMIELIDRLEAQDEGRMLVLFQDDGREERRFQTVRAPVGDDASKGSERGPVRRRLGVVGKVIQVPLNRERSSQSCDESPLSRRKVSQPRPGP